MVVAANVSSAAAAAAVRFSLLIYPLLLTTTTADSFRVVLGAEFLPLCHSAVAKASSATASPPALPRQPLLLAAAAAAAAATACCLLVSMLRKFLTVKNRLSVVMTTPSLSSLLHTRSMTECLCMGSMGGRELAVIMGLVLSVTGHVMGRRSSAACGGRRCCSNVLRELASFVSDRPTQLHAASSIYLHQDNSQTAH